LTASTSPDRGIKVFAGASEAHPELRIVCLESDNRRELTDVLNPHGDYSHM
jgi:hypothetical protein